MSSSDTEQQIAKIEKYMRHLKEGTKVGHALNRLDQMHMTFELLTRTHVGKVVNRLAREDEDHAEQARRIVEDWKQVASDHQQKETERSHSPVADRRIKKEVKEEPSDSPGESSASSSRTNNNDRKRRVKEEDTTSSYGYPGGEEERREKKKSKPAPAAANSFLAALASGDGVKTVKPKKLKPFDLSLDIDPNYRPMPSLNIKQAVKVDEDAPFDPAVMFRPRNGLTKIFAGRKKASTLTEVPRLFDCCIRVLQNHINEIESFGDIPYHIVKSILDKCTWPQLAEIERKNPYLEEDSDELWEKLIKKHHPNKETKKHETWKEMFMRCENESSDRLKMLSDRISKHGTAAHDKVRKVVAITDVKMTKGSRRGATVNMPAALELSKARKEIFESGSKSQLTQLPSTVQNRGMAAGPSCSRKRESVAVVKAGPRKGALMAKTMKMLGMKKSDRK